MIVSNVRKLMEEKGITIRKMVEDTGIADKTILRARSPQMNQCILTTLEAIADYLECTVKDLFEEVDD